jgi:hypothetical protein
VLKNIEHGLLSSIAKRGQNGLAELTEKIYTLCNMLVGYFMFYQLLQLYGIK